MLNDRITAIKDFFNVEFIDYGDHRGNSILISSGAGIGMALMDQFMGVRYFIDIDSYRHDIIDWESIGIILSNSKPKMIIFCGWFTLDNRKNFQKIVDGTCNNVNGEIIEFYDGGKTENLQSFIDKINSYSVDNYSLFKKIIS